MPSYNDLDVVKLGPVGVARKLAFASLSTQDAKDGNVAMVNKEAELLAVWDDSGKKLVLRIIGTKIDRGKESNFLEKPIVEGEARGKGRGSEAERGEGVEGSKEGNVKEGVEGATYNNIVAKISPRVIEELNVKQGEASELREEDILMSMQGDKKEGDITMLEKGRAARKANILKRDNKGTVSCEGEGRKRSGEIALIWKDTLEVEVKSYSLHHIDLRVKFPCKQGYRFTGIYGHPEAEKKTPDLQATRKPWT
uniref:Uncharacterized protein n=1 Tax=Chenopodium quinoa TaxID=63459 RepID=A0A803LW55_CHEQI